jgi:hypothetical protein
VLVAACARERGGGGDVLCGSCWWTGGLHTSYRFFCGKLLKGCWVLSSRTSGNGCLRRSGQARCRFCSPICIGKEGLDVLQVGGEGAGGVGGGGQYPRWMGGGGNCGMGRRRQCASLPWLLGIRVNCSPTTCCNLQVDLIVCWDSAPPSRLRQRSGRTGRHRPGRVVHLLLEGRELDAYHSNKSKEAKVAVG